MGSPSLKANVLGNFDQVGVGYATARDETPSWCILFGLGEPASDR